MPHIIALAVDSVIYAPLFIAEQAGYFANVDIEFQIIKPDPRPKFEGARKLLLGTSTFWRLWKNANPPLLTICDPVHALVFMADRSFEARILGILVERPACWLFNSLSDSELAGSNPFVSHDRILTHPRGMTADTIAEWLLIEKRISRTKVRNLSPDRILRGFESGTCKRDAAVSVELLDMCRLEDQTNGDHRICYDFGTDNRLSDYLMTGIVCTKPVLKDNSDIVNEILAGINVALKLIRAFPHHAWKHLAQYYQTRYFEAQAGRDMHPHHSPHFECLCGVKGNWEDAESILKYAFYDQLLSVARYPEYVQIDSLKERLQKTWHIFENVHRRALPIILRKPLDQITTMVNDHISRQDMELDARDRTLLHLLTLRINTEQDTLQLREMSSGAGSLVRWIARLNGTLRVYRYNLVGKYLRLDDGARDVVLRARDTILDKSRELKSMGNPKQPYVVLIEGGSTCGKTTFVNEMQQILANEGFVQCTAINIKTLGTDDLQNRLSTDLRKLDPTRSGIVFLDEIDKPTADKKLAFGTLLPFLRPPGDSVIPRRVVWFLAGTLHGDINNVRMSLKDMDPKEGDDFGKRILDTFELPPANSPEELAFMAMVQVIGFPNRPSEVETSTLLYLGVQNSQLSDLAGKMQNALSKMERRKGKLLRLDDIVTGLEARQFRFAYSKVMKLLPDVVEVHWDHH